MSKMINDTLYLIQGDTEEISISMKDGRGTSVKFSVGDVVYFTVRETPGATTSVIAVSQTVTSATAKYTFNLTIPAATMAAVSPGEYSGDVQVIFAGTNSVKTLWPAITTDDKLISNENWANVRVVAEVTR